MRPFLILILIILNFFALYAQDSKLMIRLAEIEIDSNYSEEYRNFLREEAKASVELEPGVISILPMYQKEHPSQVRILEIYASREAYENHLKTTHFLRYKTSTTAMIKSLILLDMVEVDTKILTEIFIKLKE